MQRGAYREEWNAREVDAEVLVWSIPHEEYIDCPISGRENGIARLIGLVQSAPEPKLIAWRSHEIDTLRVQYREINRETCRIGLGAIRFCNRVYRGREGKAGR